MGDTRFEKHLARVRQHGPDSLGELADEEVIQALAALASHDEGGDAYLANVLASEAMNRLVRAAAVLRHSAVGLLSVDSDGAGVSANPAAETMLGWSQRDLRGIHLHTLIHHHEASAACPLEPALEGTSDHARGRTQLACKDGSTLPVEYTIDPIQRDGERHGAVVAFHAVEAPTRPEPDPSR